MTQVIEISNVSLLDKYRAAWHSLLAQSDSPSFFQTLEWFEVYWKHFGQGQKLRTLIVLGDDGEPTGILPLVIRDDHRKLGRIRVLTWPLDDWGSYYGPIGPNPGETLAAGLEYLRGAARGWDELSLRFTNDNGVHGRYTASTIAAAGLDAYCKVRAQSAIIDLSGDWDNYVAGRGTKWRNSYRRWERRLLERGEISYERYRPTAEEGAANPRLDIFDQCVAISQLSWQANSPDGTTLCHDSIREFLRDVHATAASIGCSDVSLLRVGGEAVAFSYCYVYRGNLFGLRVGYNPELREASPGNYLYTAVIEDSFHRGDKVYDMGPGSLDIKKLFYTHVVDVAQYDYQNRWALKGQLLHATRWWQGSVMPQMPTEV